MDIEDLHPNKHLRERWKSVACSRSKVDYSFGHDAIEPRVQKPDRLPDMPSVERSSRIVPKGGLLDGPEIR